jgi:hypothetical protein
MSFGRNGRLGRSFQIRADMMRNSCTDSYTHSVAW